GSLPDANNPGTLLDTFLVGTGVGVSEGIKPQFSDEYLAGFDYQLAPSLSFGVRGIYRTVGDVIEDISVDGGATYFVTNPGGTFTANPVTGESLPEPVVFPRATRTYKAMELLVNKVAGSRWQLSASYVLSQNKGNYGGLFRQDNGQLDPNITSLFDLPELLKGADGLLPNDRTHQFKAYGSYRWPFKLVTGFFLQALSGTPLSKLGAHPTYGNRERFITDRGSEGRTPAFLNLDLHAEYPIRLAGKADLRFIADVFNVTNRQAAGLLDQEWTFEPLEETVDPNECGGADPNCPAGNPNYGKPLAYQGPFSLRLGVKLTW
ncbi:MAG TPA: hypothetical protein VJB88_01205, partial [Vicinamibacteria bacterium]|nr:hypothetical protein [Vicinamibacteria bacterium]